MRRLIIALLLAVQVFGVASPAAAIPSPDATVYRPSHLEAARHTLEAMLIESGTLVALSRQGLATSAAQIHQAYVSDPGFRRVTPAHQQAVLNYIDTTYPVRGMDEVMRGAPAVIDEYAPRLAALLSEEELNDITNHLRTPEDSAWFRRAALRGMNDPQGTEPLVFTAAEQQAVARFERSLGGRAWIREANTLNTVMGQLGYDVIIHAATTLRANMQRDVCDLLEDECANQGAAN